MVACDQVAPHFDCLELRNAMVSLFMQFWSCEANTGANGMTLTKSHVMPHFDHCDLINAMMPLQTALVVILWTCPGIV